MAGLAREFRIRDRKDYLRVQASANRKHSPHFVLLESELPPVCVRLGKARLGITASKKIGNAVARNRVKRRVRVFFRSVREYLPAKDYVIVARRGAAEILSSETERELRELIR